ncbi:MAG: NADH-quinone oxidoreductase subunit L, partial [Chloroflexi bacterium]|nr:NADH-quinone oxidoreductase subunit L [Chloroflexota bacterium]
ISQLGYMMLALGVGAYGAAIFHLFNHAFFKALLFLAAGSVNHATGTFDMRFMGGLWRHQRWTFATFLVAAISLAGIFPLAGFWSKDEILAEAFTRGNAVQLLVFALGFVSVFLTAFYIFRALFLTFTGEYRGGAEAEEAAHGAQSPGGHARPHLAESPLVMVAPMVVLGVLAVSSGAVANPPTDLVTIPEHWAAHLLVAPFHDFESPALVPWIAIVSVALALAGIGASWLLYGARRVAPERVTMQPVFKMVSRKYYLDELYERYVTDRWFYQVACGVLDWFDRTVVDGIADNVGWLGRNTGRAVAQLQSGQLQVYGTAIILGISAILITYLVWG